MFLGANQDSFAEAGQLGFARGSVADYEHSPEGIRSAMHRTSAAARHWRQRSPEQRYEARLSFFDLAEPESEERPSPATHTS